MKSKLIFLAIAAISSGLVFWHLGWMGEGTKEPLIWQKVVMIITWILIAFYLTWSSLIDNLRS